MKRTNPGPFPRMRKDQLIVDELPGEVLVYDLDRHKAHCLNGTAAKVWHRCDGKTPPREIARGVERDLDQPFNEDLVWLALRQLDKIHLLEEPIAIPPPLAGMSRRQMVRVLGIGAVVVAPLISSVVSPTAVQAATCLPANALCGTDSECCSKQCNGNPKRCHA